MEVNWGVWVWCLAHQHGAAIPWTGAMACFALDGVTQPSRVDLTEWAIQFVQANLGRVVFLVSPGAGGVGAPFVPLVYFIARKSYYQALRVCQQFYWLLQKVIKDQYCLVPLDTVPTADRQSPSG